MSIATPDLLNAISDLTTIREMRIALNVSAQCGFIASLSTIAGGLLGGPPGIAVGGLLGTALATFHANGKFRSVPEILATEATPQQKEKLADALRNLLSAEKILTLVQLAATVQSNRLLLEAIRKTVCDFMMTDMGYSVL